VNVVASKHHFDRITSETAIVVFIDEFDPGDLCAAGLSVHELQLFIVQWFVDCLKANIFIGTHDNTFVDFHLDPVLNSELARISADAGWHCNNVFDLQPAS
jgi:hypothetical protein